MAEMLMLRELFLHMAWADARVWQCVLSRDRNAPTTACGIGCTTSTSCSADS